MDGLIAVNAGDDQFLNNETTVVLSGSAYSEFGYIINYTWTCDDLNINIINPGNPNTTATGLVAGQTYVFTLSVEDNNGATATDQMLVTNYDPVNFNFETAPGFFAALGGDTDRLFLLGDNEGRGSVLGNPYAWGTGNIYNLQLDGEMAPESVVMVDMIFERELLVTNEQTINPRHWVAFYVRKNGVTIYEYEYYTQYVINGPDVNESNLINFSFRSSDNIEVELYASNGANPAEKLVRLAFYISNIIPLVGSDQYNLGVDFEREYFLGQSYNEPITQ